MGKAKAVAAVVIVLVVAGIGASLLLGGAYNTNAAMGVTWTNEQGEEVYVPPSYGFSAGEPVSDLTVALSYELAAGAEVTDLEIGGKITILVEVTNVGELTTETWWAFQGATATSDSNSKTWALSSLITSVGEEGKREGWTITVTGELQADGYVEGELRQSTWQDSVAYTLQWEESEFKITGTVAGGPA
jgi:hypothetical protein